MSKIKINKRVAAAILAGSVTFGGILAYVLPKRQPVPKTENELGYEKVGLIFNSNLDPEDFVILDLGDHNDVAINFEDRKIKYCNDNDISLGIVISANAETETEIYNDVEYVKGLVQKYHIDFPVFLSIDNIIENPKLNNETKSKLIQDFLTKCTANNIYVGIHGTDTNLCRAKEYLGIPDCDAFVVMDKEEIAYPGQYSVYKDLNGNVRSTTNIAETIAEKGLNNADGFVNDSSYVVAEGEDLIDIALKYGMSVSEILSFNDIDQNDIAVGTTLRIPSLLEKTISDDVEITYEDLEEPVKGCDLSYAQGADINWDKLNENFDFAILRCAQGKSIDSSFEKNAMNANMNNLPIGAYCYNSYSLDNSENKEEFIRRQEEQADYVISLLKNKKIDYPVYLDIDSLTNKPLEEQFDAEAITKMINIWCDKMSEFGYIPGVYCNRSMYQYIQSNLDYNLSDKVEIWIGGGEQFTGGTKDIPVDEVVPSTNIKNQFQAATMIQATDSAKGAGAGNHKGHLNVSYSYRDYVQKEVVGGVYEEGEQEFPIKEFDRTNKKLVMNVATGTALVTATSGALLYFGINHKKRSGKYLTKSNQKNINKK